MKRKGKQRIILMMLTASMYLSGLPVMDAYAATTKEKLEQAEKEHAETKNKLNETETNIANMEEEKSSLQGKLNQLNKELTAVSDRLADLEQQIEDKEAEIEQTEKDLAEAIETEETQYADMKKRVRFMYEKKDTMYLEILMSASGFGDFINKTTYIQELSEYDTNLMEEYEKTRKLIEEKKAELKK